MGYCAQCILTKYVARWADTPNISVDGTHFHFYGYLLFFIQDVYILFLQSLLNLWQPNECPPPCFFVPYRFF